MSLRILLLDTGKEWGGGTNSMIDLLKRIDRSEFSISCCFYSDYRKGRDGPRLAEVLSTIDTEFILVPRPKQPLWAKLLKELTRGIFHFSDGLKKRIILAIDMVWRINPQTLKLREVLRRGEFDILYMNNQPSSNLEGYLAGEAERVPVVQHARIDVGLTPSEVAITNRVAEKIICNSWGLKNSLASQGIMCEKLSVVHNGLDSQVTVSDCPFFPKGRFVLGTVGSLVARKCFDHLLLAMKVLTVRDGVNAHLIIVGEGPEEQRLKSLTIKLGIEDRVSFVGFSSSPMNWMNILDIFLFPSEQEGFGRVIVEAMLCSKPVVSADIVGPNEIVINGKTGFLYPHGDIDRLVSYTNRLLGSSKMREDMGKEGRERALKCFSVESYVRGVSEILAQMPHRNF